MEKKPEPPKVIDLEFTSYTVDKAHIGEPFWGGGIPNFVVLILTIVVMSYFASWLKPVTDGLWDAGKHFISGH